MKYFKGCFLLLMLFFIPVFSFAGLDEELLDAAKEGNTSKVMLLLGKGADISVKNDSGVTALIWASYKGHTETVKALLKKGADVNAKDDEGTTAVDYAKSEGHEEIVNLLLQKTGK